MGCKCVASARGEGGGYTHDLGQQQEAQQEVEEVNKQLQEVRYVNCDGGGGPWTWWGAVVVMNGGVVTVVHVCGGDHSVFGGRAAAGGTAKYRRG